MERRAALAAERGASASTAAAPQSPAQQQDMPPPLGDVPPPSLDPEQEFVLDSQAHNKVFFEDYFIDEEAKNDAADAAKAAAASALPGSQASTPSQRASSAGSSRLGRSRSETAEQSAAADRRSTTVSSPAPSAASASSLAVSAAPLSTSRSRPAPAAATVHVKFERSAQRSSFGGQAAAEALSLESAEDDAAKQAVHDTMALSEAEYQQLLQQMAAQQTAKETAEATAEAARTAATSSSSDDNLECGICYQDIVRPVVFTPLPPHAACNHCCCYNCAFVYLERARIPKIHPVKNTRRVEAPLCPFCGTPVINLIDIGDQDLSDYMT